LKCPNRATAFFEETEPTHRKLFFLSSFPLINHDITTMAQGDSDRVREAQKIASTNPRKAEEIYKEIISKPPSVTSDAAIRDYETALISLGELYRDEK
jgi:hypothetical protein